MELLHDLHASGTTVLIITHDREIAASLPRQVSMRDGRIVADSAIREGVADSAIREGVADSAMGKGVADSATGEGVAGSSQAEHARFGAA
jgi:energy-coupling factor transporter ATP-binding protein EcfA2